MEGPVFLDEQGQPLKMIDGEVMFKLLRLAWNIGCAHGAQKAQEMYVPGAVSDKRTIRTVNRCLTESWQSEEWCKNFVEKMYKVVKEEEKDDQ